MSMTERERIQRVVEDLAVLRHRLVVGGSAAMALHGIDRVPADIDIYTSTADWFVLYASHQWRLVTTPPEDAFRRCDPPFLSRVMHGIEVNVFFHWRMRETGLRWIDTAFWIENAIRIDDVPTVPLQALRKWKTEAARNKDFADIELINAHLEAR